MYDLDLSSSTPTVIANPQGYFYRVVDVTDNPNSVTIELQTPMKQTTTQGMVVVMNNVVEVFDKSTISMP